MLLDFDLLLRSSLTAFQDSFMLRFFHFKILSGACIIKMGLNKGIQKQPSKGAI